MLVRSATAAAAASTAGTATAGSGTGSNSPGVNRYGTGDAPGGSSQGSTWTLISLKMPTAITSVSTVQHCDVTCSVACAL
jgi:hypothetical protein